MAFSQHNAGQTPLLLITTSRDDHQQRLCGALSRIWETPDFHIQDDVRSVLGHVIGRHLQGHILHTDIGIIDLEKCKMDAPAIFSSIRSISELRYTPVLALVDTSSRDVRDSIYDAGADLVVDWENLEGRIGDIAGLVVDNWLNTDPELGELPQAS
jgi:hypothetical protein